jgi:putative polyketide hydroxylase
VATLRDADGETSVRARYFIAADARGGHDIPEPQGGQLSTLDLFGEGFVLLAGSSGAAWRDAAVAVAGKLAVPLTACTVGADGDLSHAAKRWTTVYGIEREGAVLVRPDGHVGWRCGGAAANPRRDIAAVLRRLLATAD